MTRLVIVDDDATMRATLGRFFRNAPDLEVVGEACDGLQALALIDEVEPDVVLMDVQMPGLDGIETARRLRAAGNAVPVLFVTAYPSAVDAAADVVGARVLIKASVSVREMLDAVREAGPRSPGAPVSR